MFKFNFENSESECNWNAKKPEKSTCMVPLIVHTPHMHSKIENDDVSSLKLKDGQEMFFFKNKDCNDYKFSLLPNVYEGGCELWESTVDLLNFLSRNRKLMENQTVLDLGCGSGLLGIFALQIGAEKVIFQDFNAKVIENYLFKNIKMNFSLDIAQKFERCKFVSGDWNDANLVHQLCKPTIILSSETLYDISSYDALICLFEKILALGGKVFLASKLYYFGVGGSVDAFIERSSSIFSSEIIYTVSDCGVGRRILLLQRK